MRVRVYLAITYKLYIKRITKKISITLTVPSPITMDKFILTLNNIHWRTVWPR